MKYEFPKESVKTKITKQLNQLNKRINKYNKNPPRYLATPSMLKRFNQLFNKTTLALEKMTKDPEQKWLGRYHGEFLEREPYCDFKIESHKSFQYWVKLNMPTNPQVNVKKYETLYLGLITNKKGQIIDFEMDVFVPRILRGIESASN